MIQIIPGDKGTGKTKRLIDLVNESLKGEHGDIIFIDDDKRYIYDLRHEIRFVDASEYMGGYKATAFQMLGFMCGMLSMNYDISLIAMDAFVKLVRTELESSEMENFFARLEDISREQNCSFMFSVSVSEDRLPEFMKKYVI